MTASPFPGDYLSCDWGTSSFRLRWISSGRIIEEVEDATGCGAIFEKSAESGVTAGRGRFYEQHLLSILARWEDRGRNLERPLPLVISGMASSTIGWQEVPYTSIPMKLDGSGLRIEPLRWSSPRWIGETYLISGVASDADMMRGEETEAIGLMIQARAVPPMATLLLPGTHSKHLRIAGGAVTAIHTCMTGELYDLLARRSVLRSSVETSGPAEPESFRAGVACAQARGLSAGLFQTRTRQVLHGKDRAANASFLSGLLIGAELRSLLPSGAGGTVFLGGVARLRNLYRGALRQLGIPESQMFTDDEIQRAVPLAHGILLAGMNK